MELNLTVDCVTKYCFFCLIIPHRKGSGGYGNGLRPSESFVRKMT